MSEADHPTTDATDYEAINPLSTAVETGDDYLPDDAFPLTGDARHPDDVLANRLDALDRRLSDPYGQTVHAINIGDAGDLDGGTATALLRYNFGGGAPTTKQFAADPETAFNHLTHEKYAGHLVALPAAYRDYYPDPADVLEQVLDVLEAHDAETVPVYWTDLGVNEDNADRLRDLFTRTDNPIRVRDHHTRHPALDAADDVIHNTDKCAAEIVLDHDVPDAPDYLRRLVDAARVRDLWLTDRPDFTDHAIYSDAHFTLGDFAFNRLAAEFGADLLETPGLGAELTRRREEKEMRMDYALDHADWHTVALPADHPLDTDTLTICLLRGDFYVSEAARRAYVRGEFTDRDADVVVAAKPSGSVSLRSHDDYPVLDDVAAANGGGGHPNAAGFSNPAGDDADLDRKATVALETVAETLTDLGGE